MRHLWIPCAALAVLVCTPGEATAIGLCEDLTDATKLIAVDPNTGDIAVQRTIEWCDIDDEGEEDGGVARYIIVYEDADLERVQGWYSGSPPEDLEKVETPDMERIDVDELPSRFVGVEAAASAEGCFARIEAGRADTNEAGWEEADATAQVVLGETVLAEVELGTIGLDADDDPVATPLFFDGRVALWTRTATCSGPPPGYFGEDDPGMCYADWAAEAQVLSIADHPALALCSAPTPPADDLKYVVIAKSFKVDRSSAATKATALAGELTAAGFADARVWDSRAFAELTDGFLAVLAGRYATRDEAKAVLERVRAAGWEDAYVKAGW